MITGRVTAQRRVVVEITLRGFAGESDRISAIVDTGYNGWLSLPVKTINRLRWRWKRRSRAEVADGRLVPVDIYEGLVEWDGHSRAIPVDAAETHPLIGMSLIWKHDLHVSAVTNGEVRIVSFNPPPN